MAVPVGGGLQELASGVDALYLSGMAAIPGALIERLEKVRSWAQEIGRPVPFQFGGEEVWVAGHNFGKYRYCIKHEHGQVGLTPRQKLPAIRVQPRAEFLHGYGAASATVWFRELLQAECGPVRLAVSRIDLHADFQGWMLTADDRHKFVCRATCLTTYEAGTAFNGLQFGKRGSGTVSARIYDKTQESAKSGAAYWPEIWGSRYDPDRPVLRVELEIGRAALRQYRLDAPEEVLAATGALWVDLTTGWLSLRVPTNDQTRSRWPLAAEWEAVRRARISDGAFGIERTYGGKRRGELQNLAPMVVGFLANVAALAGSERLEEALPHISRLVHSYCRQTGVSFEDRVAEKSQDYLLP
jgi:hypothetical protein